MKFLSSQVAAFMQQHGTRRNIAYLMRFLSMLFLLIALYTVMFHYLMEYEGQSFSWLTGVYWTLTVMSTLGFGDITFTSDLGRLFSIIVLLSGVVFFLVMLPFTFIQYFYAPWLEAQKKEQIPRSVPDSMAGHVIVVGVNPIALNLIDDLKRYGVHCVLLSSDGQTTLGLLDQGYTAVMGEHDNGDVYRSLRLDSAAMLIALDSDVRNTNIVFTARDVNPHIKIIARVEQEASVDILELAGATRVFQFYKLLGEALARRVLNGTTRSGIISRFEAFVVAETPVMRTVLVGKSPRTSGLRAATGINIVGVWERGSFHLPSPDTVFTEATVLVTAGTEAQMQAFDAFLQKNTHAQEPAPVVILGGGRVGRAAAAHLQKDTIAVVVVDKSARFTGEFAADGSRARLAAALQACREGDRAAGTLPDTETFVYGDAADLAVLERAGIRTASSVLITTHDDDTNIYLTLYCRRLRPDIQIISRASLDRNVDGLHAAGADLVLSLASMMTSTVMNTLSPGKVFMLNEGLMIFRTAVMPALVGKTLLTSDIRQRTHCSVIALHLPDGKMQVNPEPSHVFVAGEELYLIGDSKAEALFYEQYGHTL